MHAHAHTCTHACIHTHKHMHTQITCIKTLGEIKYMKLKKESILCDISLHYHLKGISFATFISLLLMYVDLSAV